MQDKHYPPGKSEVTTRLNSSQNKNSRFTKAPSIPAGIDSAHWLQPIIPKDARTQHIEP